MISKMLGIIPESYILLNKSTNKLVIEWIVLFKYSLIILSIPGDFEFFRDFTTSSISVGETGLFKISFTSSLGKSEKVNSILFTTSLLTCGKTNSSVSS